MKRTHEHSWIELWSLKYINDPKVRAPEDRNKRVVQIEPSHNPNTYMVEVVEKEDL